jgi:PilZ domain
MSETNRGASDDLTADERRASVRHVCNLDTLCQPSDADEPKRWPATVCDISLEGIGVLVREPFQPGTVIGVDLTSPDETLEYTMFAKVMNVQALADGRWRAGCAFTRKLSDDELQSLL